MTFFFQFLVSIGQTFQQLPVPEFRWPAFYMHPDTAASPFERVTIKNVLHAKSHHTLLAQKWHLVIALRENPSNCGLSVLFQYALFLGWRERGCFRQTEMFSRAQLLKAPLLLKLLEVLNQSQFPREGIFAAGVTTASKMQAWLLRPSLLVAITWHILRCLLGV